MKKLLAVLLAALMLTAFAGCGDDKTSEKSTASAKADTKKSDTDSSKKYATLKSFLDDPVNTEGADEAKKVLGDSAEYKVYADGNTVVYDFRLLTAMDSSMLDSVKASLETSLDTNEEIYKTTVSTIQDSVDEDIALRIVYHAVDGTVITERTYKP